MEKIQPSLSLPYTSKTVPDCLRRDDTLRQSGQCDHSHDYDFFISVASKAVVNTEHVRKFRAAVVKSAVCDFQKPATTVAL